MNIRSVNFTFHAIKRFILRYEKSGFGKLDFHDANELLIELLKNSEKFDKTENFFNDETIRINKGWIFILSPDETVLLTVDKYQN